MTKMLSDVGYKVQCTIYKCQMTETPCMGIFRKKRPRMAALIAIFQRPASSFRVSSSGSAPSRDSTMDHAGPCLQLYRRVENAWWR